INCQPASSCTTTQNAALTGNPRQITVQNKGVNSATHVSVSTVGLPIGTRISDNTCKGTLNPGGSCLITLTPGAVASSDIKGIACTSGTPAAGGKVIITADGGLSTQVSAYVLSYGCQFQGGFIYSVDDTTPNNASIGGKVVTLADQAPPSLNSGPQANSIIWSSNGTPSKVSFDEIPGIDERSASVNQSPDYNEFSLYFMSTYTNNPVQPSQDVFKACNASSDGSCNTNNILAFYNTWLTKYSISCDPNHGGGGKCTAEIAPPATPLTNYAAGLCRTTINGYDDWYLPAICEMDAVSGGLVCIPSNTQSMVINLSFLLGDSGSPTPRTSCTPPKGTDCLAGSYWSSTEAFFDASGNAWFEAFMKGAGSSLQIPIDKDSPLGVRCTRALTP
ncbi:MAG: hypothetical protein PSV35_06630, partial [bacterium]|nr:hypothetical protein [bacterium]